MLAPDIKEYLKLGVIEKGLESNIAQSICIKSCNPLQTTCERRFVLVAMKLYVRLFLVFR